MQISVSTKAVVIVGGVIVALGGIAAGVATYNHNKAEQAKAEAAAAYANRPIISHDNCVMNGLGEGTCGFTNTGKTAGAVCGKIVVTGPGTHTGSKFCSGMVAPMSTNKVEFDEPPVRTLCEPKNYLQSWTDVCSFQFVQDGLNGGDTSEA